MKGTTEEKDTRGTLAKARDALLETLNLKSRRDDDEEEDDDEGAPSEEDRVKAAAPKEAAPKQDDDQDGDTDDDDESDGDDDEDDEGDDAEQRAPAPAAAPAQAQAPPQQAAPQGQQAPPPMQRGKKQPPPPMRKSIEEADDDDLMAEIQRRIADPDTPEFMKSLASLDSAPEIFAAIDMSPAVAAIVQLAAEQLMAKDVIISQLTKSHTEIADGNNEIVQSIEVVLRALPKMIAQSDAIQKSLAEIGDDVALVKSQDNGKVSHGTRPVLVKSRVDPKTADEEQREEEEVVLPDGLNSGRLTRGLMKAMSSQHNLIAETAAMDLIGKINGQTGMRGVWSQLSEPVREVVLATR